MKPQPPSPAPLRFTAGRHVLRLTRLEFLGIVKSFSFLIVGLLGMATVFLTLLSAGQQGDLPTRLTPRIVAGSFHQSIGILFLVLIVLYSGEVIWREREGHMDQLFDCHPIPDGVFLGAKFLAVCLVPLLLWSAAALFGLLLQWLDGNSEFNLPVRIVFALLDLLPILPLAGLVFFIQVLVNHKYAGHLINFLLLMFNGFSDQFGLEHPLFKYGHSPRIDYSDLNGFGTFLTRFFWTRLHWSLAGVILLLATHLFWVRGRESCWRQRFQIARRRLTRPLALTAALGVILFLFTSSVIFISTNILNPYRNSGRIARDKIDYEIRYRQFNDLPQPRVRAIAVRVELYPDLQRAETRGTMTMRNDSAVFSPAVHLSFAPGLEIRSLVFSGGAQRELADRETGYHIFKLDTPLPPQREIVLEFFLLSRRRGFKPTPGITPGATTIPGAEIFPHIGYDAGRELVDAGRRQTAGLVSRLRLPGRDDRQACGRNCVTDSDRIDFDAVVGTTDGQLAIAPGELVRRWSASGRDYFHYRTDRPMLNCSAFFSGRFGLTTAAWNDVTIEIFHHPRHDGNVPSMIRACKKTLAYASAHFGPYPQRRLRIVELPDSAPPVGIIPGIIPFPESACFLLAPPGKTGAWICRFS